MSYLTSDRLWWINISLWACVGYTRLRFPSIQGQALIRRTVFHCTHCYKQLTYTPLQFLTELEIAWLWFTTTCKGLLFGPDKQFSKIFNLICCRVFTNVKWFFWTFCNFVAAVPKNLVYFCTVTSTNYLLYSSFRESPKHTLLVAGYLAFRPGTSPDIRHPVSVQNVYPLHL
jgi:hypothetical protein